jgi:hypothetical protein
MKLTDAPDHCFGSLVQPLEGIDRLRGCANPDLPVMAVSASAIRN